MSIRSNLGTGPIAIETTDTVIFAPSGIDRYAVTALNIHNTTATRIQVEFFISPNLTSASGKRVDYVDLFGNDEIDVNGIVGQGYENQNVIAKAATAGINASLTRTEYTDGD